MQTMYSWDQTCCIQAICALQVVVEPRSHCFLGETRSLHICETIEVQGINGQCVMARARFSAGTFVRSHTMIVHLSGKQELQWQMCMCSYLRYNSFSVSADAAGTIMSQKFAMMTGLMDRHSRPRVNPLQQFMLYGSLLVFVQIESGACMTLLSQLVLAFMCRECMTWCMTHTVSCFLTQPQ